MTQPNKNMRISDEGVEMLKVFEGFRAYVYLDSAGLKTIGYGHLLKRSEQFTTITKSEATALMRKDLRKAEKAVCRYVGVPLEQNEYDSLVCLTYNIGAGAFQESTLLECLNDGDFYAAGEQIKLWKYAGGEISQGLINRREKEYQLFMKEWA